MRLIVLPSLTLVVALACLQPSEGDIDDTGHVLSRVYNCTKTKKISTSFQNISQSAQILFVSSSTLRKKFMFHSKKCLITFF